MSVRLSAPVFALALALAGPALADVAPLPVAPAPPAHSGPWTAAQIQAQLWAALGPIGGDQAAPGRRVRVVAEGDHFRLFLPFLSMMNLMPPGPLPQSDDMTATLRNVGGRWDIGDIRNPSPVSYAASLPQPHGEPPIKVHIATTIAEQNGHASFDPTYATPSAWSQVVRGLDSMTIGDGVRQTVHADSVTSEGGLTPAADGKLDFDGKGDATNFSLVSRKPHQDFDLAAERIQFATRVDHLNRQQIGPLLAAAIKAFSVIAAAKPGTVATMDPATKAALLGSFQDLAEGGSLDESADGLRVQTGGKLYGASHAGLGFGASTPNGQFSAYMDISLDGLLLPQAAAGPALLPSHFAIRPSVSGIDMHALTALVRSAGDKADARTLGFQALGLLATGDVQVAIDTFALDIGRAKFAGNGVVHVHSPTPQGVDGTARVTAQNFDSFIQQVQALSQTDPHAARILPELIYAKGLGTQQGGKTVWDVSLANGTLLVNGIDVLPQRSPAGGQSESNP